LSRAVRHAAALALALSLAGATAHAKPLPWLRAQTPHFSLYARADRDSVTRLARNLESMCEMLEAEGFGVRSAERQPVTMVAIPDRRDFEASLPVRNGKRAAISGLAHKTPFGTWIGFAAYDERGRMVAHHELLHTIVDAALGGAPLCLNEGLAEFYSTWRATARGGHYGDPIPWHVWELRSADHPFTLDELFDVRPDSPVYLRGGDRLNLFYAESWALVHYLMRVDGRSKPFREMALAIATGMPPRRAFARSFPGERWDEVPNRLAAYVGQDRLPSWEMRLDRPLDRLPVAIRGATPAEVDANVGMWRVLEKGVDARRTRALLERAAAGEGARALALAGLGVLDRREKRPADALRRFRAAAATPGAGALALSVAGGGMLMQAASEGARDEALAREALGVLGRSVTLDSTDATALGWYGRAALAADRLTPRAMRALEKAATALPTDGAVASAWASALSHTGQSARARRVLETHGGLAQDRGLRDATGATLDFDAFRDSASALAKAGRYDELQKLLDRTEHTASDKSLLAAVRSLRAQLAEARHSQRWIDRYNDGVRALNADELEKARDAFAAVRDSAADDSVRAKAAARVAELAGMIEFRRGMKAFEGKDYAAAVAAFDRARKLATTDDLREKSEKNAAIARRAAAAARPPAKRPPVGG